MLIIVVIFVVGGLLSVSLSTLDDSYLFQEYTERIVQQQQIFQLAESADILMRQVFKVDDSSVDYLGEDWSKPYTFPIENGSVSILIVDQERYFNPNFLVDSRDQIDRKMFFVFQRLFQMLNIDETVLYNIIDWIDKNKVSSGGIEIYDDIPAKNSKISTLDELKQIAGITTKIFNGYTQYGETIYGLKEVLSVYSNGKVNINTAPKVVLMALDPDIDEAVAQNIISYRSEKPFRNVNDLALVDGITSDIIYRISNLITVKSETFLVKVEITVGSRKYKLEFLYKRDGKNIKKVWQRII